MSDELENMLEEFEGDKQESLAAKMKNMTPDQFARFVKPIEVEYARRVDASVKLGDLNQGEFEQYRARMVK